MLYDLDHTCGASVIDDFRGLSKKGAIEECENSLVCFAPVGWLAVGIDQVFIENLC